MTIGGRALLLCAGSLAIVGCSGGGAAPTCADGQPCLGDGGADTAGDVGAPATCGSVQPCGGDLVGEWTFTEACESAARIESIKANFAGMAAQSSCVSQTLVSVEPGASGSLVVGADGTYSLALVFGGTLDIDYPASCLAGLSCDDATAGFQSQIEAGTYPMPNVSSISCSGFSNCLCRAALNRPSSEEGTYSVSGSVVTFAASTGRSVDKSYCVVGNALHILSTSAGSTGQTVIDSDLIAVKE